MNVWRFSAGDSRIAGCFEQTGFAVVENVLDTSVVACLMDSVSAAVGSAGYAMRNLLKSVPAVLELAESPEIRALVEPVLGRCCFAVKGILFDKTPEVNWKVAWHQDTMICVQKQIETPGFGPWSVKEGVLHVQPPAAVLAGMMTVRVHLDECGLDNGPLRVIPKSHQQGQLKGAELDAWREKQPAVVCTVPRGGALLMRPLTLHASSAATVPGHRRVLHLEFASQPLPNGLHWAIC